MTDSLPEIDPYAVLGVPQGAPQDVIEVAYELLRTRYPKADKSRMASQLTSNEQLRVEIDRAYAILSEKTPAYNQPKHSRIITPRRHFSIAVALSRPKLPIVPEEQTLYARLDITPHHSLQTEQLGGVTSGHLNLSLVLDRSNSMQGSRLDRVKAAAYQIIDSLQPDDVLSIVAFSDRASVIIPATKVIDKARLKAQIALLSAFGGTELYHGLAEGLRQNREFLDAKYVNHILIITDGNTYGDEQQCLDIANNAASEGVGISAMGLGTDWNDDFLDKLAATTGGVSQFIRSVQEVSQYINSHVRHLANTFAERVSLLMRLAKGVEVTQIFKLAPHPQPMSPSNTEVRLGILEAERPISMLIQFKLPASLPIHQYAVGKLIVTADILANPYTHYHNVMDITLPTTAEINDDPPPTHVLDALSRLALYRMQESANEAIKRGDIVVATQRLEKLATRLLAMGQAALATQVLHEAQIVKTTHMLSADGKKTIKYHTRQLVMETKLIDK